MTARTVLLIVCVIGNQCCFADEPPTVVVETAPAEVRAGLVGDDAPKVVFAVKSGDDQSLILRRVFADLALDPKAARLVVIVRPALSQSDRARILRIAFDDLGVLAVYPANNAVAALSGSGRFSGVALEIETTYAESVPVNEHVVIHDAIRRIDIRDEVTPKMLAELVVDSINGCQCSSELQDALFSNIVTYGSQGVQFELEDAIRSGLHEIVQKNTRIKVIRPPESRHLVWAGASILASLSTTQEVFVKREAYNR